MLRIGAVVLTVLGCGLVAFTAPEALSTTSAPHGPAPTVLPTTSPTPSPATPTSSPTALASPAANLAPTSVPLDPPELRGVWVDAFHDGFKTPQQVDQLVAWARAANLNALYVEVRKRGDAYYLQSFEPQAEDATPGFDALQYLISQAHSGPQRLQVHAWLATLPIWGERDRPPSAPNHVFNLHGLTADPSASWLMQRDDGATWAGSDSGGIYYLDPGKPDAARYTIEVYLNLLRNYDVDGIHLDQVRYYEGDPLRWGYNPSSVARFNQRYGRDPSTQPAPDDPDWIAWRRDQVTNLVRDIYLQAKALKPNVAVSAAVVTWGQGPQSAADWMHQAPYAVVLQDWRAWLAEGIVDYVVPMDYFRETDQQAPWFDAWTRWEVQNAGQRGVVLGLGSYLNPADGVLAQLGRARALGSLGVALYSYAVPDSDIADASGDTDPASFATLLRGVFARPAPVPPLAWAKQNATGGVAVQIAGHEGVSVTLIGPIQRSWTTDGAGIAGGVDLPVGTYRVLASGAGVDPTPIQVQVQPGQVTTLRYAPGSSS